MEIKVIKRKFRNADYPPKYLNSVIHQITTHFLFHLFFLIEIPYCEENENASKHFIKKFEAFPINIIELQ